MENFKIRTYGWQELAILYAPDLTPESAGKRLSSWIRFNPKLTHELQESGWKRDNGFSPRFKYVSSSST